MIFGVDISEYQSNVNYQRAVSVGGVQFAIIRAGYGRYAKQKDALFEKHYSGFKNLKIPVGAYQYSYAKDIEGAKAEAEAMVQWLKGKSFELPVYYDLEDAAVEQAGKQTIIQMALTWCEALEAAGYKPGIYANQNWWNTYLDIDLISKRFSVWVAKWSSTKPAFESADLWQFGGESNFIRARSVEGIASIVDQDYILNESLLAAHEEKIEPEQNGSPDPTEKEVKIYVKQLENGDNAFVIKVQQ